ncbi:hypothetical protein [Aquimarina sp. AU58]|uniref:hypothetical protein n=1 Tax=Aquimarina sp. AU58 TaxID=1874112 RepID=UPI000D6E1C55|nr:hypothetical protein [Aquimarina sp. AU58]
MIINRKHRIKLNFFDNLDSIDSSNLPEKYSNEHLDFDRLVNQGQIELDKFYDIEDLEGYHEIIELHKCEGMLAIHEVLLKLDTRKKFESLNYNVFN